MIQGETRDLILIAGQSSAVGFDAIPSELPTNKADQDVMFWCSWGRVCGHTLTTTIPRFTDHRLLLPGAGFGRSGCDQDLEDTFRPIAEDFVALFDVRQ